MAGHEPIQPTPEVRVLMRSTKETKNTRVFEEVSVPGQEPRLKSGLYILKTTLEALGNPDGIEMTIRATP